MSKNWAICIGINRYYNLQPLKCAVNDAASLRDFFLQGVKFERVYYFADDSPPIETERGMMRSLPTYANLKRFFREWFQANLLSVGDNFWFFFAGHGEIHDGHDYLLPIDVDPGDIPGTALRVSDIADSLRNCGADNAVMLVDACRDRGKRGQGFGTEEQPGLITIYSCSPNKSSYEIEALQHGSFTYALLEALRLQGANNCATVERLDQYLCAQVPALNAHHGKPHQMPRTSVEPRSKSHLILIPQQATRLQDVQVLKNDAYRAEIDGNLLYAQQLWVRVLAASPADQDAVEAIGRIAVKQAKQTPIPPPVPATASSRSIEDSTNIVSQPAVPAQKTKSSTTRSISSNSVQKNQQRKIDLGNGVSLELVSIPGGTFAMGSPNREGSDDEKPQHWVTISPFEMGKYLVTQAQWRAVTALPKVKDDLVPEPSHFKGENLPVEKVNWYDAVEFCKRISKHVGQEFRLPSKAEWEYACRAGTNTPYYFGDKITREQVNCKNQKLVVNKTWFGVYQKEVEVDFGQTTPVDRFPANAFGLHDMHGNLCEWCADHDHRNYEGAPLDGTAWLSSSELYKIVRGGSWFSPFRHCRSAYRGIKSSADRNFYVGFRVICDGPMTLV